MRPVRTSLVAGVSALALALLAAPGTATADDTHQQNGQTSHAGGTAARTAERPADQRVDRLPAVRGYRATSTPTPPVTERSLAASSAAGLAALSPGTRALVADADAGRLPAATTARTALARLEGGSGVAARYRDASPTALDLQALALLADRSVQRAPAAERQALRAAAPSVNDLQPATTLAAASLDTLPTGRCGNTLSWPYTCSITTAHTKVQWSPSGFRSLASAQLADADGDGTADFPQKVARTLERAYSLYVAQGLTAPSGSVLVTLNSPASGAGVSLPNRTILLPGSFDEYYLPAHELFHQFEWPYILQTSAGWGGLATFVDGLNQTNWWMEATAEWGAKLELDQYPNPGSTLRLEARNIPTFFATTAKALSTSDGLGGSRQYGVVPAPQWFTERLGSDFVRRSWEQVANDTFIDSEQDLVDTITGYGVSQSTELGAFYDALTTMCDLYPTGSWDTSRFRDPVVPTWCSQYLGSSPRPAHGTVDPVATDHLGVTVGGGGASYTDMTLPSTETGRVLTFTAGVSSPYGHKARILLRTWGAYSTGGTASPAQYCDQQSSDFSSDTQKVTLEVRLDTYCPHLTMTLVNADLRQPDQDISVSWTTRATGAVISNGVIRLGVNDDGSLAIDDGTRSAGGSRGTGLRYLPTNNDGIAPGCYCEGWGLSTTGDAATSGSADQDSGGLRGGTVQAFRATATEAWSTVAIGAYTVVHHYFPSSDPRMYQVDVFVTRYTGPLFEKARYRRVMDFDAEPTAFSEYVSVHVGSGDPVVDSTNDGFADPDPTVPLSDLGHRGSFTDVGPDDQGAAFDIDVPVNGFGIIPAATLFYGAGSSAADATAGLQAVGATTWALAKPTSSSVEEGTPNTFAFGYKSATTVP